MDCHIKFMINGVYHFLKGLVMLPGPYTRAYRLIDVIDICSVIII